MQAVWDRIADLMASGKESIRIAIDGRSGAGKTTLAREIVSVYDCNVFHMDDFFLPPAMRTAERLGAPGGNVHYERFFGEVLTPLMRGEAFSYGVFDCSAMEIGEMRQVTPKGVNVIEGSYSHHPFFGEIYDLKIFLTISSEEQAARILRRNGEAKAAMFRDRWIPMEERYFAHYGIMESSHIVVG